MAKKIGLALGAGSTKGFAHIGVLQQLEEEGIHVDILRSAHAFTSAEVVRRANGYVIT